MDSRFHRQWNPSSEVRSTTSTEKKRRCEELKYIVFSEYCPKDRDKVVERAKKITEKMEKNPEKYPKWLYPPHNIAGGTKTFIVVEATPEQLMNQRHAWMPLTTFKAVPIFDARELTERYPKLKE